MCLIIYIFQPEANAEVISIDSSSNSDRLQIDDESNESNESDKVRGKSAVREIEPTTSIERNDDIEKSANNGSNPAAQEIFRQNVNEVLNVSKPGVSVEVNEGKVISDRPIPNIQVTIENVNEEDSTKVEETTDPLNLAQVSLMTDDNSVHSDKSTLLCSENLEKPDRKEAHKDEIISLETGKIW